jgi:hypothetical protein
MKSKISLSFPFLLANYLSKTTFKKIREGLTHEKLFTSGEILCAFSNGWRYLYFLQNTTGTAI